MPRSDTQFRPGQSGNPAGRPFGSRNKLAENFIAALCEDFEAHGEAAIAWAREENPAAYLRLVASLVPKQFDAAVTGGNVTFLMWAPEESD